MRPVLCLCAEIPRLGTRTRIRVVLHVAETFTTTGTARWVGLVLPQAELEVYGAPAERDRRGRPALPANAYLLYPSAAAEPLTPETGRESDEPLTLVIPDGTWRQASKMIQRDRRLSGLPTVCLPPGPKSIYRLRTQRESHAVSTYEAVARALGILEGPETEQRLLDVFRKLVDRTLWTRGQLPADQCWGGIPEAAFAADRVAGERGRQLQRQRRAESQIRGQ
jgi:DTW domain-containing protein YfiP